jgi:hypothetical protein
MIFSTASEFIINTDSKIRPIAQKASEDFDIVKRFGRWRDRRGHWKKTAESFNHPVLRAVARFARLAAADIDLGQPYFSEGANTHRRFDDKLRSARRNFDGAVKEILFPELIPTHLKGRAIAGLYASYTTFVLYLTMFDSGERQKAGILQAARYDAFMELVELRSDGLLRF